MRTVFITGTAGFIGFHLAQLMLDEGFRVVGYDGMTDYYDVDLKRRRHQILLQNQNFSCTEGMLEDDALLSSTVDAACPDVIVHLAGQAGVRYSLENPRAYMESNVMGTFNVMECARRHAIDHLLMASTSSIYGANTEMPFTEAQPANTPLTLYAATKRANEHMGHCYAHLWNIPTTMFRFFTVYGPYGRPDMALFKFVKAGLSGERSTFMATGGKRATLPMLPIWCAVSGCWSMSRPCSPKAPRISQRETACRLQHHTVWSTSAMGPRSP